jgi:predicted KAP-like P-loop ATPase
MKTISADKPLLDPKEDYLGYSPFARHLAENISTMPVGDGLVIAVYGSWGGGKSSLLNFVLHYLQQKPEEERPVIIQFNPWWFSSHQDLIRQFFQQLRAALLEGTLRQKFENILSSLASLFEIISMSFPYVNVEKAAERYQERQISVPKLKQEIAAELRKQNKKILIVMDDIDRLTADEIRQIFRMVKTVADFPNILYLLAFDKEIVTRVLTQEQGIPGESYLEKIVQVPFELPVPDKERLQKLFFDKLSKIFDTASPDLFDSQYWESVYWNGINTFLHTPRDVTRLINTINITYSAVKSEVNPVDFVAIEALRVFCSQAYHVIRTNPAEFTAGLELRPELAYEKVTRLRKFHDGWLKKIPARVRPGVKQLVTNIFPKLETLWNGVSQPNIPNAWQKQLRICDPDIFDCYFRLSVCQTSGAVASVP